MKRVSKVLALAMMLTLLLGLTAQASSSTTTNTTESSASSPSSAASSTSVAYAEGVTASDGGQITSVSEGIRNEALAQAQALVGPNASIYKIFDYTPRGAVSYPYTATFSVSGITAGMSVTVLHKGVDGWEVVPSSAGNGTVTATFTSLSPVAIVVNATSAKTADSVSWIAVCAVTSEIPLKT